MALALVGALLMVDAPPVGATHKLATPTNVQATAGNGQVSLSVDAVTNATQYRWQYGTHPSGTTATAARGRTTTISSLSNGQVYRVRVSARAIASGVLTHQDSDWSDWVTFTPRVPLNDPSNLAVSVGNAALSLSWTASTSTGVTGYDVHYTSAAASAVTNNAAVTTGLASAGWVAVTRTGAMASQTISSLSNGTPYRVRVRAKSSTGLSGWVFGAGTPRAASATLSGPATVVEGQALKLRVTFSPATTVQGNLEVTATRVTSESGDHAPSVYLFSGVGTTNGSINFATHHDDDQDDETFTVTLTEAPTGYSIGSPSSVSVTIVDDDKPSVSLSASPNPVREGDPVTVTAQLSHATLNALTIPVVLSRGTSESGDHGTLTSIN
ncbi:MAG: fibronectin type III domain-containing protein, partial [bacterium]|nr:fibronectin type III domain-containing protein [bacterium]